MSAGPDEEGHLTFTEGGGIYPGLCHCARNEAHYAEWSKPEGGFVIERNRPSRDTSETTGEQA